ncbi:MAG TPA: hypothetical protein VIL48_03770 [Acidimicrobiales bacterium]
MRRHAAVPAAAAGLALVMATALAACGGGDDDTADTGDESPAGPAAAEGAAAADGDSGEEGGDFCASLQVIVGQSTELMGALVASDGATIDTVLDGPLTDAVAAAQQSAPDDLSDDIRTVTAWTQEVLNALEAAGGGRGDLEAALADVSLADPAVAEAGERINEYARTECGFDPEAAAEAAEVPEPPDPCTFVEPSVVAAAASAAGASVDTSDGYEAANFDLGVFAIRGCVYERGAMVVSTVTFAGGVDAVLDTYVGTTEANGGTVTDDFDRGGLPASTLITAQNGTTTITVFEAATPFSVGFSDVSDPAALVAAAETVLAAVG